MKRFVLGIVNGIFLEEIIFFITYVYTLCSAVSTTVKFQN